MNCPYCQAPCRQHYTNHELFLTITEHECQEGHAFRRTVNRERDRANPQVIYEKLPTRVPSIAARTDWTKTQERAAA